MTPADREAPPRWLLVSAFAVVYLVWGSTYLAIRIAIESIPPFLMAGSRFLVAGLVLYAYARASGAARPLAREWRGAAVLGALFLFFGNGGVVWAETRVASSMAAVIVAVMPLWTVVIERLRGGPPPARSVVAGLVLGLGGVALLLAPGGGAVDLAGALVLTMASVSWAYASVISRSTPQPESGALRSGMQMLAGGGLLVLAGTATGEWAAVDPAAITTRSALALLYLVLFGSLLAFSAFTWLLRVTTPARVATYAYVNPVVAVLLGWAIAGEPLGVRHLIATTVIVGGVALITAVRARRAR